MNSASRFLVLSLTAACLGQSASAVQIVNEPRSKSAGPATTSTVERGGTVDAVNTEKKTVTVDGRSYTLGAAPVTVHAFGKDTQGVGSIRPGTKIRFNTSKNNYAGVEQIVEVWIAEAAKQPNKK